MGGYEEILLGILEPSVRDHSGEARILMAFLEAGRLTVSGGQFDWGGHLLKGNGGVQRFPQLDWKPSAECKGIRELDCETDRSSRCESRS